MISLTHFILLQLLSFCYRLFSLRLSYSYNHVWVCLHADVALKTTSNWDQQRVFQKWFSRLTLHANCQMYDVRYSTFRPIPNHCFFSLSFLTSSYHTGCRSELPYGWHAKSAILSRPELRSEFTPVPLIPSWQVSMHVQTTHTNAYIIKPLVFMSFWSIFSK